MRDSPPEVARLCAGPLRFDESYTMAGAPEMLGGPGAEHAGADDGDACPGALGCSLEDGR